MIKAGIKNRFQNKRNKKERLKEPLKMFYVTKVSFLNN